MSIATINNYLILYGERQSNLIPVRDVWERVSATFWMYCRTMLLFGFIIMAMYILMIIPVAVFAYISPGLIFLGVMILFFGLIYMVISLSLTFIVRAVEKRSFFDSMPDRLSLSRKWWSTFGLIMILYFVMMTISYIPLFLVCDNDCYITAQHFRGR